MAADPGSLGGSLAPGLSQAEPKPYRSGAEAQGGLWGGREGDQLGSHAWLRAVPRGQVGNLRQASCPFFSEEGLWGWQGRGA